MAILWQAWQHAGPRRTDFVASEAVAFDGLQQLRYGPGYAWQRLWSRLSAARPQGARSAAPLPGEDDRAQPGASDALDCPLSSPGHGGSGELSAAPLCAALHAGRH